MPEGIDGRIAEYFNNEENLHHLRQKLFNLSGYRLQSDFLKELSVVRKEKDFVIEDLNKRYQNLQESYQKIFEELMTTKQNQDELSRWQSDYGELAEAYRNFSSLSSAHKDAIAGIFGGCDTPFDFLCGSVQKGHLEQLWDYVSDELDDANIDEYETDLLSSLFNFSFAAVNRSQRELLFRRLTVPQGSAFDVDTMGRTSDSPQLGRVKKLVFAGFAHEVTGIVVRRSLVKLE